MTYLLAFLTIASLFHFVHESILAPSLRLQLRFELFKLRDELRTLKIEVGQELHDKHYHYLQDSINSLISLLYRFDLATLRTLRRELEHNAELKKRAENRRLLLEDCRIERAHLIWRKTVVVALAALGVNSAGWFVYLVPILGTAILYKALKAQIKSSLAVPEYEIKRVVPDDTIELAA